MYVKSHTCLQFCSAGATINKQQVTAHNSSRFMPLALNPLLESNLRVTFYGKFQKKNSKKTLKYPPSVCDLLTVDLSMTHYQSFSAG